MTHEQVQEKLAECIKRELGRSPYIEVKGPFVMKGDALGIPTYSMELQVSDVPEPKPKSLQVALDCNSLELASIQMAIEEAFGLKFGTGPADRGEIDREWDELRDVVDLEKFVEKWTKGGT